jgi:hypothetical protein
LSTEGLLLLLSDVWIAAATNPLLLGLACIVFGFTISEPLLLIVVASCLTSLSDLCSGSNWC